MKFHKFHSLGNDFVILEKESLSRYQITPEWVCQIANRNLGIGFDQLLIRDERRKGNKTWSDLEIWNADGSRAQNCINGIRSLAEYEHRILGKPAKSLVTYQIGDHRVLCERKPSGKIMIQAGRPLVDWRRLGLKRKLHSADYPFGKANYVHQAVVGLGNLHWILFQSQPPSEYASEHQMKILQRLEIFPSRPNITLAYLSKEEPKTIQVMTYERGTGWTQACGSAACATAVAAIRKKLVSSKNVTIQTQHGKTQISWKSPNSQIQSTGQAQHVYTGTLAKDMLPTKIPKQRIAILPSSNTLMEEQKKYQDWILVPLEKHALQKSVLLAREEKALPEITFQEKTNAIWVRQDKKTIGYLRKHTLKDNPRLAWKQSQELLDLFGPFCHIRGQDTYCQRQDEISAENSDGFLLDMASSFFDCLLTENKDTLLEEIRYRIECHYAIRSHPVARDSSGTESVQHIAYRKQEIQEFWSRQSNKIAITYQDLSKSADPVVIAETKISVAEQRERDLSIQVFYQQSPEGGILTADVDKINFLSIYGKPIQNIEGILDIIPPKNRQGLEEAQDLVTLHLQIVHGLQSD